MSEKIFAGVDLGTTNSAVTVFRMSAALVVKNNLQEEYTPSSVYETTVQGRAVKYVGRKAKDMLLGDPANVALEFKLKMGMPDWRFRFPSTGREATAAELSAEILSDLANSVKQRLGDEVVGMVITVPAAFLNPMYEDTKEAGKLAGIPQVELLVEPVAAALAFASECKEVPEKGCWIVFDLGGGTFDAALVRVEEGVFTVFDHAGDQRLGMKDIDAVIVERYFLPKLPDSLRGNVVPWESDVWWKLKFAAEKAKVELSTSAESFVKVDFPKELYDFECVLTEEELVTVQEPIITKSIEICQRLLAEKSMTPDQVDRLILVGGPTSSPYIRKRVAKEIGVRVDHTLDALTAVAKGVAIYAKSRQWKLDKSRTAAAEVSTNLHYPGMTYETEPLVTGTLHDRKETAVWTGWHVELQHLDAAASVDWTSKKVPVNEKGTFAVRARCTPPDKNKNEELRENRFRIAVTDPNGREVSTEYSDGFTIQGIRDYRMPTLARGIGVVKSNDTVCWFFDAGQPLPCEKTVVLKTTRALKKGEQKAEVLNVSVVEEGIDKSKAKYNWWIGTLRVRAEKVFIDIPEGADVEVTIEVDESRSVSVSAYFPDYDVEPDVQVQSCPLHPFEPKEFRTELEDVKKTVALLETLRAGDEGIRRTLEAVRASGLIEEAEKLIPQISDANPDAGLKAKENLMRLEKLLETIAPKANELHKRQQMKAEFVKNVEACKAVLNVLEDGGHTSPEDRMQFNHLVKQFEEACEKRDLDTAKQLAMADIPGLPVFIGYAAPDLLPKYSATHPKNCKRGEGERAEGKKACNVDDPRS